MCVYLHKPLSGERSAAVPNKRAEAVRAASLLAPTLMGLSKPHATRVEANDVVVVFGFWEREKRKGEKKAGQNETVAGSPLECAEEPRSSKARAMQQGTARALSHARQPSLQFVNPVGRSIFLGKERRKKKLETDPVRVSSYLSTLPRARTTPLAGSRALPVGF